MIWKTKCSPDELYNIGVVLEVGISHPREVITQLVKEGKKGKRLLCRALIDTGAAGCAISPRVVQELGLIVTGHTHIIPPSSPSNDYRRENVTEHLGMLFFPWGDHVELPLVCVDLNDKTLDCIIGRDVLKNWYMVYDGISGEITICN